MVPQSTVYRNLLECHLCDGKVKNPKALPCLHSFCHECLRQYIPSKLKGTQLTFPCPKCLRSIKPRDTSKPFEEWADLFPDNFFLLNILNSAKLKSILNSSLEESILITKQSLPSARYKLFCRSLSLRKHKSSTSLYSQKSIQKEQITKSVTFAPLPELESKHFTKQRNQLELETSDTGEISCKKILRSSLKTQVDGKKTFPDYYKEGMAEKNIADSILNEKKKKTKPKEIHIDLQESFHSTIPGMEAVGEPRSIIFSPDGSILVADPQNWNIKKFTREGRLLDLLKLSSEPGDMALISNSQVAIPLFKKYEILFISFNSSMKITGRLSVARQYHRLSPGVGWTLIGLSLCPVGPPMIDVFYYTGEIVHNFLPHVKGREANLNTSLYADIIISSCQDKVLSGYDGEGGQKFKRHNTDQTAIVDPKGLCTDMDGYIYLADGKVNKIHRFTPDGVYDCEFLTEFDGIQKPAVLCVDSTKHEMVVAQSNGEVKIFSFRRCLDI